ELARIMGEDGTVYEKEANKIYNAIQKNLWLPAQGSYAEFKDLLGNQLVHPSPGLWTIYQAIDSKVANPFQSYLNLRYVDDHIPHIPVQSKGLNEKDLYLLSTTDWQPYTWSLNNVVLAENLNTSLAYWQGNRSEDAYRLWRSALIESMYLGSSPGNFEQLSFYDAIRGELYRDFADPVGVAGRTLVEGLFGIQPDALHDTLTIQPGFPMKWNYASLKTPDIQFDFKRNGNTDSYIIKSFFKKHLHLKLIVQAVKDDIEMVTVNGKIAKWQPVVSAVATPSVAINIPEAEQYNIIVRWKGKPIASTDTTYITSPGKKFKLLLPGVKIIDAYDPQKTMDSISISGNQLIATGADNFRGRTAFIKVKQGIFTWWQPICLNPVLQAYNFSFDSTYTYSVGEKNREVNKLDLTDFFNDKVTNIFKHQYLSPRPTSPTLQLPTQGIGNWAYPLVTANINDSGTRKMAAASNEIKTSEGIPFAISPDSSTNNILFVSQWDNFPKSSTIPLPGKANEIHLLMAGSTNPMQSRITNGRVIVNYKDGSADTLNLDNPQNWWPIEQDYFNNGLAFTTGAEIPERLYLKQGKFGRGLDKYDVIKGFSNRAIDGGAATVLHMYLNNKKELKSLTVQAVANDVVIGLMAVTLDRN
ncbi:MAG: glycogen debranching protein, partial [Bacteroidetes bacterium]|nr:glycogen debranching protein [Bacteroidota bacterium]